MNERRSFFSHLENIQTSGIEFSNPFFLPAGQLALCRYELYHQQQALLQPDHELGTGLGAYRSWLPPIEGDWPDLPLFRSWQKLDSDDFPQLIRANLNPDLLFAVSLALTAEFPVKGGYVVSAHEAETSFTGYGFSAWPRVQFGNQDQKWHSLSEQRAHVMAEHPGWANFGPWGNGYRLEGLRAAGLELIARLGGPSFTLILHDYSGEVALALIQAAEFYRHFEPNSRPFRLILVQEQPWHPLCQVFEGAKPDPKALDLPTNSRYSFPPEPLSQQIARGIESLSGTAIALPPANPRSSDAVLNDALGILLRTHFVDDDDEILMLSL